MDGLVERQFGRIGARVRVHDPERLRHPAWRQDAMNSQGIRLDVRKDHHGEFFDVQVDRRLASVEVLDARPAERHLLLMARNLESGAKEKFLCGHDERSWFVAAVPGKSVSNVTTAMEALKPVQVRAEQARRAVSTKDRKRRRNSAYVRQGEWFFVPVGDIEVPSERVFRNEPIRRGAGKPHIVEYLARLGGETVYVSAGFRNGLTAVEHRKLLARNPKMRNRGWQVMRRNAQVYAKGRVSHSDHKTVYLNGWHRVLMNTETQAPAMQSVAFLD